MVAEIYPFVQYHAVTIITGLKDGIFELIYLFNLSSKMNETLLPCTTFYAELSEHKIGFWMLKFTNSLRLKVGF